MNYYTKTPHSSLQIYILKRSPETNFNNLLAAGYQRQSRGSSNLN